LHKKLNLQACCCTLFKDVQNRLLMQLVHVLRSRMYASATLGVKDAKFVVLMQPDG